VRHMPAQVQEPKGVAVRAVPSKVEVQLTKNDRWLKNLTADSNLRDRLTSVIESMREGTALCRRPGVSPACGRFDRAAS
jgi:hypothetical protein